MGSPVNLVLNAVEPAHEQRREAEVRVGTGIPGAIFHPLCLGALAVGGNADGRRPLREL